MEHEQLYLILVKHRITGYVWYTNNILLLYDQRKTDIGKTLAEFNEQQPTITITVEKESHNSFNFLSISMHHSEK
jgi:hypothetical protein